MSEAAPYQPFDRPPRLRVAPDGLVEVVEAPPPGPTRKQSVMAVTLFLLTALSTFLVGGLYVLEDSATGEVTWGVDPAAGSAYAGAILLILLTHELGHYIQARRNRIATSLPYFIPMPLPPFGTMGAIIVMREQIRNTKALFDIGISGPLAGLVPTLVFLVLGLQRAQIVAERPDGGMAFGEPLLVRWLAGWILGPVPEESVIVVGSFGMAGWVGLFITALNLIPIGQLDGGHVLYALLGKRAHPVAIMLLVTAIVAVLVSRYWTWSLMLLLLVLFGPKHPPTRDDDIPLGVGRTVLGWATLLFVVIGFTPKPFVY